MRIGDVGDQKVKKIFEIKSDNRCISEARIESESEMQEQRMAESHAGIGTEADNYLGSPLHGALSPYRSRCD